MNSIDYGDPKTRLNTNVSWKTIFFRNSGGFSSKRILSVIGFISCVIIFISAFILDKEVPEFGETLLIGSISLYGAEVIPNFWSKTINKN